MSKPKDITELQREQIILEYKYNPKRRKQILLSEVEDLKEEENIIWTSVYDIVYANMPSELTGEWAEETTSNFIAKIMDLDGKNTPIQSIIFAFINDGDKVDSALLSMSLTQEIAKGSPVIDLKVGTTMEGEDSVTIYPKLGISITMRNQLKDLYSGLPMLCKPQAWTSNTYGGYLTDVAREHIILGGSIKHHEEKPYYESINYLQDVGFKINKEFFLTTEDAEEERWVDGVGGRKYKTGYKRNREITKFYLDADKPFYFVQQIDNRGRSYCKGYNINIQGYEYQKAVLQFADKQELTDEGLMWAKTAVAGLYGLDKEIFDVRLKWFEENIQPILWLKSIEAFQDLIDEAEEGHMFKAALMNLMEAI